MKEVKEEIYGTRPSVLEGIFVNNNIKFNKQFWFVTCRQNINNDKMTRYLVLIENNDVVDTKIFKPYIPVYRVNFIDQTVVKVSDLRSGEITEFTSHEQFKLWVINKTKCEYVNSSATGSTEATALSRFFREKMGKGFALTDIDFYIVNKHIFVEEKTYIENGMGHLGEGQYYSFKEIQNDICHGIKINIVLINQDQFYIVPLESIVSTQIIQHQRWGRMIRFNIGRALNIQDLVQRFK